MKAARVLALVFASVSCLLPLFVSASSCPNLTRNLGLGLSGNDVLGLQKFLVDDGDLISDNTTGYFGINTQGGVQRFQIRNRIVTTGSATSTGFGAVGPKTRTVIKKQCPPSGGGSTSGVIYLPSSISPSGATSSTYVNALGKCPIIPLPTGMCSTGWLARAGKDGCISSWLCIAPLASNGSTDTSTSTSNNSSTTLTLTNSSSTVVSAGNQPPIILSVQGPITLSTTDTGTWTIHASAPSGGALQYRFNWGDTGTVFDQISGLGSGFSSASSGSHSYGTAGLYTPIFSVEDSAGNITQSAAQVTVTAAAQTNPNSSNTVNTGGTNNQNFGSYGGGVAGQACAYEGQQSFTACPYMANCNGGTYLVCHNGVWANESADQYACADPKPCITRPNGMILCVARKSDGTCPLF